MKREDMESKQQIEERRQKLREELINIKLAQAVCEANAKFDKQLQNCLKKGDNYYRKITI